MATKISAVMTVTDTANKQGSKSITDIDPNASDLQVKNFLVALNALTTNTLNSIELVTKKDITDAHEPYQPNVTVYPVSVPCNTFDMSRSEIFNVSYNGAKRAISVSGTKPDESTISIDNDTKQITITGGENYAYTMEDGEGKTATVTVTVAANDDYAEGTATISITQFARDRDIVEI